MEDDAGLGDDYGHANNDELQDFIDQEDAFNVAEEELFLTNHAERVDHSLYKGIKATPPENHCFPLGQCGKLVLTLPMRWGGQGAPQFPVDVGGNLARIWVDSNLASGDNYLWVGNFSAVVSTRLTLNFPELMRTCGLFFLKQSKSK